MFDQQHLGDVEVSGACFVGNDVAISTSEESDPDDGTPATPALWSPATQTFAWRRQLDQTAKRFAVTDGERITVVHLGEPAMRGACFEQFGQS